MATPWAPWRSSCRSSVERAAASTSTRRRGEAPSIAASRPTRRSAPRGTSRRRAQRSSCLPRSGCPLSSRPGGSAATASRALTARPASMVSDYGTVRGEQMRRCHWRGFWPAASTYPGCRCWIVSRRAARALAARTTGSNMPAALDRRRMCPPSSRRKKRMPEQKQVEVKTDAWDVILDDENGPAAIVIRECLRPAAGPLSPVAPPTFAGRGQGDSDYNFDGEDPRNWESVLKAVSDGRVANRCTLDSIPSQANRMESGLKRFEGRHIPKVTLIGSKHGAMSLLDVGHRVADAALWSADGYDDFQTALEAYVQGNALPL